MEKVCGQDPGQVQRDIELREAREFGSKVVEQLGSLGSKNPEMVSTMQLLFSQAGLPPAPSPSGSRASSQPSTARSSYSGRYVGALITVFLFVMTITDDFKDVCTFWHYRSSSSSRFSATPTAPLQSITMDMGGVSGDSQASTPRPGRRVL